MIMSGILLTDAFDRIEQQVHAVLEDLDEGQLTARVDPEANTIAWLIWHLTRVQDDHIADVAGTEQVWTSDGWYERFNLPFEPSAHGYGHSSEDVAAVKGIPASQLAGYHDAVHRKTATFIEGLEKIDLERVVDTNWDPPVTLATRLVSVISDDLQHVGQAAYVKGLL